MEIVWSKLAYEHFLEILIYVENNFCLMTAQAFFLMTRGIL